MLQFAVISVVFLYVIYGSSELYVEKATAFVVL